jgi:hypothetical protein
MKTLLNKTAVKALCASMLGVFCLTVINSAMAQNAEAQTYDPYAVEVINKLIDSNGLEATPDAPETWDFATWNDSNPKQLVRLVFERKGLHGNIVSLARLTSLQTLTCWKNAFDILDLADCTQLQTLYCTSSRVREIYLTNCTQLDTLGCGYNFLTTLDLTGTGPLRQFYSLPQEPELDLYGNETEGYTIAISLNNPNFNVHGQDGVSYSDGILKVTNPYLDAANGGHIDFTVETNKAGYKLEGYMLPYLHDNAGINTTEKANFKVYPNPATETVFIDYEKPSKIKVYNMLGKEVFNRDVAGKTGIDIRHLPKGLYIVRVFSEGKEVGSTKVIKS